MSGRRRSIRLRPQGDSPASGENQGAAGPNANPPQLPAPPSKPLPATKNRLLRMTLANNDPVTDAVARNVDIDSLHLQWTEKEDDYLMTLMNGHTDIFQVVRELARLNPATWRIDDEVRARVSYLAKNGVPLSRPVAPPDDTTPGPFQLLAERGKQRSPSPGPLPQSFNNQPLKSAQIEHIKVKSAKGQTMASLATEFRLHNARLRSILKREPHNWRCWTGPENQEVERLHDKFGDDWDRISRARTRNNPNCVRRSVREIQARFGALQDNENPHSSSRVHICTAEEDDEIRRELAKGGSCQTLYKRGFRPFNRIKAIKTRIERLGAAWLRRHDKHLEMLVREHRESPGLEDRLDWAALGQRLEPQREGEHARLRWGYLQEHERQKKERRKEYKRKYRESRKSAKK